MTRIPYDLYARDFHLKLGYATRVMGIINCTPDSFSGDGKLKISQGAIDPKACLHDARRLVREGADILDVGGESTRPGAVPVSLKEEIRRVIPVISLLAKSLKIPVSVDTSKPQVARRALEAGASIVNNVRGTSMSNGFLKMVRDYRASLVIMHMRGTPSTMHLRSRYKNVVKDVVEELKISVEKCLAIGIKKEKIIIDPGIGFAKTTRQNLLLIKDLDQMNALHCPILLGTSRKSFIGEILDQPAGQRLTGTLATVVAGVMQGAHIVRVHDVKSIKETLKVTDAILNSSA